MYKSEYSHRVVHKMQPCSCFLCHFTPPFLDLITDIQAVSTHILDSLYTCLLTHPPLPACPSSPPSSQPFVPTSSTATLTPCIRCRKGLHPSPVSPSLQRSENGGVIGQNRSVYGMRTASFSAPLLLLDTYTRASRVCDVYVYSWLC